MKQFSSLDDWFLEDTTPEEFEQLSGEERIKRIVESELSGVPAHELRPRVAKLNKAADEFLGDLRKLSDQQDPSKE